MNPIHLSDHVDERTTLAGLGPRVVPVLAAVGLVGLGAAVGLGWARGDGLRYFFHAYLTSYCFLLSISLGALFFVALQHVTRAGWSVTVRRLAEVLAGNVPLIAVLFLPILGAVLLADGGAEPGSGAWQDPLYEWNRPAAVAENPLVAHKTPYLSRGFFAARAVVYLAVWAAAAWFYLGRSRKQDETRDPGLTLAMERASPVVLLAFAATVTFASFDWLMSLAPEWYSTIFGVYYFSGAAVGSLAVIILAAVLLQAAGRLRESITVAHYHDLGKLLFAFVFFWGYIAFSQYMLIWYGNIPEETRWYLVRQQGGWQWVSLLLLFGNLLIPFLGLLSREAKRRKPILAFWAVWLLAFHWLDIYYLVMPSLGEPGPPLGPIDACCLVGLGGLYLAGLLWVAGDKPLVPLADPRRREALAFEQGF
jgi:hypothetical protein